MKEMERVPKRRRWKHNQRIRERERMFALVEQSDVGDNETTVSRFCPCEGNYQQLTLCFSACGSSCTRSMGCFFLWRSSVSVRPMDSFLFLYLVVSRFFSRFLSREIYGRNNRSRTRIIYYFHRGWSTLAIFLPGGGLIDGAGITGSALERASWRGRRSNLYSFCVTLKWLRFAVPRYVGYSFWLVGDCWILCWFVLTISLGGTSMMYSEYPVKVCRFLTGLLLALDYLLSNSKLLEVY